MLLARYVPSFKDRLLLFHDCNRSHYRHISSKGRDSGCRTQASACLKGELAGTELGEKAEAIRYECWEKLSVGGGWPSVGWREAYVCSLMMLALDILSNRYCIALGFSWLFVFCFVYLFVDSCALTCLVEGPRCKSVFLAAWISSNCSWASKMKCQP